MLQVARLAPKLLADSSGLVREFVLSRLQPDGGFADRAGRSDLYYTVFGLESLLALQHPVPAGETARYLRAFGDGEGLDFVHLTCLARCWAGVALDAPEPRARRRR
jgi:prenyltransferase beta subunit